MMALILLFLVLLLPPSQAACVFPSGWKSVADVAQALQVEDGGGATLIPTKACSLEQGYCLTFFSFVPNKYYLSMVAFSPNSSTLSAAKIIWTANRGTPVPENSTLDFTVDGDLILQTVDKQTIWSTYISGMALSICGGNLVLVDAKNESAWDSFSHPTDTLIPSQTLRIGMKLTSSKSSTDLSEGSYSLAVAERGIVLYYYNTNTSTNTPLPYWVWPLNINDTKEVRYRHCRFDGLIMASTYFSLLYLCPMKAPFIIGHPVNGTVSSEIVFRNTGGVDPDPYTYLRLEHDGVLRAASFTSGWSNVFELDTYLQDPCFVPSACRSNQICEPASQQSRVQCTCPKGMSADLSSDGCKPQVPLEANCSGNQTLEEFSGIDYYPNKYMTPSRISTEKICKDTCLANCSCVAAFYWPESLSCFHATGNLEGLRNTRNQTQMAYLKIQQPSSVNNTHSPESNNIHTPSSKNTYTHSGHNTYMSLAIGLGTGLVVIIVITVLCVRHRLRKRHTDLNSAIVEREFRDYRPTGHFGRFSLKEVQDATQGFATKIGQGAFGTVFLGSLKGKGKIAVKRVECSSHGKKSFRSEIESLGNIQHSNLVHLLGFCVQGNELLLVYEFVANGSLDQWIFHRGTDRPFLNWKQRWHIVCGVARGLAYLHHHCRKCVLHLDVKPHNILLDENFEAKVSDFGLSCLMEREQSHLSATMRGTPGYLAPEWLLQRGINSKSDIYSFGKVVLELISGRKNMEASIEDEDMQYYPSWAWEVFQKNRERIVPQLVDPLIHGEHSVEEVEILLRVGFMCIQAEASKRPTMDEVVKILSNKKIENCNVVVDPVSGFLVEEQGRGREMRDTTGGVMEVSSTYTHGR